MTLELARRLPDSSQKHGRRFLAAALFLLAAAVAADAQQSYQKPPQAVLDVLNAPVPPQAAISPTREHMLLVQGVRYPPISELAQPMLRLAGLRINPNTSGRHRAPYFVALTLKKIADGVGAENRAAAGRAALVCRCGAPTAGASPSSTRRDAGIELWAGEAAARARVEAQGRRRQRRLRPARPVDAGQPHAARADRPREARRAARRGVRAVGARTYRRAAAAPARPHLSGPAEERARRGALRLLRHVAARLRGRGVGEGDAVRTARHLRRRPSPRPTARTSSSRVCTVRTRISTRPTTSPRRSRCGTGARRSSTR